MYSRAKGEVAVAALTSLLEQLVEAGGAEENVAKDAGSGGRSDETCNIRCCFGPAAMMHAGPVARSACKVHVRLIRQKLSADTAVPATTGLVACADVDELV